MSVEEEEDDGGGTPAWMATFADLSTLLLTFFVLLFTFAEMDVRKFAVAMGSIKHALGETPSADGVLDHNQSAVEPDIDLIDPNNPDDSEQPEPSEMEKALEHVQREARKEKVGEQVAEIIEDVVEELEMKDDVEVETTSRGVVVKVKDQLFFNAGGASLEAKGNPVLDLIADIAKSFPAGMAIEGHTDNIPVRGGRFKSNWELSAARAYATLDYLSSQANLDPSKLQITGYADTRPVATNDTPEGRAKNRRVEFVFLLDED